MNAEKALKTLEYQKILDMLKTHVSSERARELADETRPTDDKNLAESWLTETFEALSRSAHAGNISSRRIRVAACD